MSPVAAASEVEELFDLDLQVVELDTRTVYGAETRSQTCNSNCFSCPGTTCQWSCGPTCQQPLCSDDTSCQTCR
jgi:hypothetical protein